MYLCLKQNELRNINISKHNTKCPNKKFFSIDFWYTAVVLNKSKHELSSHITREFVIVVKNLKTIIMQQFYK